MDVQLMQKARGALTKSYSLGSLRGIIQPFLLFNSAVITFRVLRQQSDVFGLVKQLEAHFEAAHQGRNLVKWTRLHETGHQNSMERIDFYHIRCWKA